MKKIISSIILIVFLVTTNVYALDSNSTFDEIVKNKSEIPTDISIKKKNGKYGVVDKKTKEVLIPYQYEAISPLGIDTVMLCEDKSKCIISTNNNIQLVNVLLDKKTITVKQINADKPKDIENTIFYGLINDNKGILVIPVYSSKNLFNDIIDIYNKVSWLKFDGYPFENNEMFFYLNNKASYYIKQNGEAFEFIKNSSDLRKNSKLLYRLTGIEYTPDFDFKEEVILENNNVIVKYREPNENFEINYSIVENGNLIGLKDKEGKDIILPKPYIDKSQYDNLLDKQKIFLEKLLIMDNNKVEKSDNKEKQKRNFFISVFDAIVGVIGLALSPLFLINPFFWIAIFAFNDLPNHMFPEPGHQNDKGLFW